MRPRSAASCFEGHRAGETGSPPANEVDAPRAPEHLVQFYDSDDFLVEVVTEFIRGGLEEGVQVIAICTAPHREAFLAALAGCGVDVTAVSSAGQLTLLDARETLARFLVDGMPDPARFAATVGAAVEEALRRNPYSRIRAYGEMVDLLWREGNPQAAIRLEELWNELQARHCFSLLCAYVMASFYKEPGDLQRVCAAHTHVLRPEQQRSTPAAAPAPPWNPRMLTAEIAQRREVERALRDSIQELRRKEHELERSRIRAELLYQLAAAVIRSERLEEVFAVAVGGIEQALGANRSAILTFDAAGVMRFRRWHNLSDAYRHAVEGHSPWPKDATAPEAIVVPDVRRDPGLASFRAVFDAEGIAALVFVPLVAGGRLLGKFMVYYDGPRSLSAYESEIAAAIANQVAAAIARFDAMERLREIVRYNELFGGVLAHDLRNPLGSILTSAQLVLRREEARSEMIARPLGRIINSGNRMARMVEQLLDFTRARVGGGFQINRRETDLAELARQVIDELEAANSQWRFVLERTGSLVGSWDPDRLLQVISNLAANAGQHGAPAEAIRIRLDGDNENGVTLQVHNKGAVPEAVRATLFDPFRRAHHRADNARGLGLGLFITRELVAAHGGKVTLSSSDSDGTTFTVELPRAAANASN